MELFDQLFFNAIVRANLANIVIQFSKTGNQGNIWCNMPGSSAAGKDDAFHNNLQSLF